MTSHGDFDIMPSENLQPGFGCSQVFSGGHGSAVFRVRDEPNQAGQSLFSQAMAGFLNYWVKLK